MAVTTLVGLKERPHRPRRSRPPGRDTLLLSPSTIKIHWNAPPLADLQEGLYVGRQAKAIHRADGHGPWRHIALYILGVQRAGARQTVTEHRDESIPDERLRRCRKGEGRMMTSLPAGRCKARGTSINPAVHDDTAIACRAPVRLQTASSKARTVAPTVTIPDSQLDSRSAATSRRGGSVGRMMGKSFHAFHLLA